MTRTSAGCVGSIENRRHVICGVYKKEVHIRRARRVEMCWSANAGPVMATIARLLFMISMTSLAVWPHVAGRCVTVRRLIMTGDAAARVDHRIDCMAGAAGRAYSAIGYAAEISAVAERTHAHELGCLYISMSISAIIPMNSIPGTDGRMGSIVVMTSLAAQVF